MPRKGVLGLFIGHRNHRHDRALYKPSPPKTFSTTLMEDNISSAESIVNKWDVNSPQSNLTPLFYGDRDESARFSRAVHDLQRAMVFFSSDDCLESPKSRSSYLIRAQTLMQMAMKRLEKEFYQILSSNRDRLDPESVSHRSPRSSLSDSVSHRSPRSSLSDPDSEDDIRTVKDSVDEVEQAASTVAMADLRSIAQTMISAGYGRECVRIYNQLRKSIVEEGLYRLGFENLTPSQVQKLDWEVLDLKIRSWLAGSGVAIRTLLSGERILCDHVFEGFDSIKESCFAEITKEAAVQLLAFPELVVRTKRSSEKLFRILDLHSSLSDLWTDIESVFSFESTAAVRSQCLSTFMNLGEAARATVAEFGSAIEKESSKSPIRGGAVHPLTRYVMNYLSLLADYDLALADVFLDFPFQAPSRLPESFFDSSRVSSTSSSPSESSSNNSSLLSIRFAWLILVLLCKLDSKAGSYKDVALSYLFLANNLHYIVKKVKDCKLRQLLGEDWVTKHKSKVRHYASSYQRLGWARLAAAIPAAEPPSAAAEKVRIFYSAFEEAVRAQRDWVVVDKAMRREVKASVADLIMPAYQGFYETYRPILDVAVLRYAPEDLRARIAEVFSGSGSGSGSGSWSGSDSGSVISVSSSKSSLSSNNTL